MDRKYLTYLIYISAAVLFILMVMAPKPTGLFAVEGGEKCQATGKWCYEVESCPDWTKANKPCEGAVFSAEPKCQWDISGCKDYCASQNDCKVWVDKPNDCTIFFEPEKLIKIGTCSYSFCQWQQVPQETGPQCSSMDIFLQKYKWWLFGAIITIIVSYILMEIDFGGRRRGFF